MAQSAPSGAKKVYRFHASEAAVNKATAEVVADERLGNHKGTTLKAGVAATVDGSTPEADLVFHVKLPAAGRYMMHSYAVTDAEGAALMKKAKTKFESLFMKLQVGNGRPTKRVVYVPWDRPRQETGKFEFDGGEQAVKIWLPRGVRLEYIELTPYTPPAVPPQAQNYRPAVVPPAAHPRLWVNRQSLPLIKSRLAADGNQAAWEKVKKAALTPFVFEFDRAKEVAYNAELEVAAESKAFYYLMTGDKKAGREAITLMTDYLSHVEFGNILDITREIGRAIYYGSEVYDWCYDLLSAEEKKQLCKHLLRLADDMEIGWPPFLQKIINGHGNEAQVNRDLLSMSIAIYNENPLPYQYCAYTVLEDLVPMRKFEYQSPRHNQGVNYGAYRMGWEMHAAWLLYRMTGQEVFDPNIKNVRKFWQYMRMPNGQMLRDGDGFGAGKPGEPYYWKSPLTMLLFYAYAADPVLKGEFVRQGGLPGNPVLFLLLNDPALQAEASLQSLPLTLDFGPVLGAMVTRTGWNIDANSNDVVAEIKGGGYHFGNHQHSDAGAIQLYYRGMQFGDLGVYKFYGTPYDFNFNKRSIAHSMMLAVDPAEKFTRAEANDGGTKFNQRAPTTVQEVQTDPWFNNGKVLSADFGPSKTRPFYSYFAVDLTGAYTSKMNGYNRGFCFLNLGREDVPAAIILTDDMTTASPGIKKYWQINALNAPETTANGVVLTARQGNLTGKTHINMLLPAAANRQMEVRSGPDANNVFDKKYEVPNVGQPEENGHRIMISPKKASPRDRFLTVLQLTAGDQQALPVKYYETPVSYVVLLADRVVSMSNSRELINKGFSVKVPGNAACQIVLTGMAPGKWNIRGGNSRLNVNTSVEAGKNTIFLKAKGGTYTISPQWAADAEMLRTEENFVP
ncbi:hypothetical protein [Chitinophaga alhagiae]|uniref:hypothetical protein n=1 Tax=Chitinophaga alhagiae TaxID=2203219 RepID=UPI0018E51F5E|nr:hypothetical protein [Chitinophaga alhagiae]